MNRTLNNDPPPSLVVDVVAQDARDRDVLAVTVRATVLEPQFIAEYLEILESLSPSTPFYMVVDLKTITLKKNGPDLPPLQLDAAAILSHYEPEFAHRSVDEYYLSTLIDIWLHDLQHHWKSEIPPGSEGLAEIGLLERLKGGWTRKEVLIGDDSLHCAASSS